MKILLAEDEEDIRRLAAMCLKRGTDWQILEASDGEECLSLANQEKPDLILLDAVMPNLDGFQACQRLKTSALTKDIPVIFLTASVQEREMQKGLSLGAIGYLYKPFDPTQLRQQVLSLLAQAGRVSSSHG